VAKLANAPPDATELAHTTRDVIASRPCARPFPNALEHSPHGAPVNLIVERPLEEDAELALIDVIDEGPGVAPSIVPHTFERFVTGEARKGLGIGLFLANRDRPPPRRRSHPRVVRGQRRALQTVAPDRLNVAPGA